jgi:hypothetical protein
MSLVDFLRGLFSADEPKDKPKSTVPTRPPGSPPSRVAAPAPVATPAPTPPPNPLQAAIDSASAITWNTAELNRFTGVIARATTFVGVGAQKPLLRFFASAEEKGGFLVKGANATFENLELWEAASVSGNGAGIRFEARAGVPSNVLVKNCVFRYNQNGILGPDNSIERGTLTIENCEFDRNGRYGSGQEHGIYIGRVDHLIVRDSHFHDTYTGHELKSRAFKATIERCTFGSVSSLASYEAEFPNGGDVSISDCTFIQGRGTDNGFVLGFGAEWKPEFNAPVNRLIVRNCVLWNFLESGYPLRVDAKVPNATVEFHNCTFINFVNTYQAEYAPLTIAAKGTGNRVLTLAQGYAEFPNGPRETETTAFPEISREVAASGAFPERRWFSIAGTRITEALDVSNFPTLQGLSQKSQLATVIDAWGGAVRVGDEILFQGTGHGDGAFNARAAFHVNTLTWRWATPQSNQAMLDQVNRYQAYLPKDPAATWHTRALTPQENAKQYVTINGERRVLHGRYPDGLPAAFHGYTNAFPTPDGGFGVLQQTQDIALFSMQTQQWRFIPAPNVYTEEHSMRVQADAQTGLVYAQYAAFLVFAFDMVRNYEVVRQIRLPHYARASVKVEREIWYFGGTHGEILMRLDLDTQTLTTTFLDYPRSHRAQFFASGAGAVYDPTVGVIRMDAFGQLFSINTTTLSCEAFGAPLPVRPFNEILSRMWVHRGAIWAVPSSRVNAFVFRL